MQRALRLVEDRPLDVRIVCRGGLSPAVRALVEAFA